MRGFTLAQADDCKEKEVEAQSMETLCASVLCSALKWCCYG
jgi:hypothetical protein